MDRNAILIELGAVRAELESAADALLAAAEKGIRGLQRLDVDQADCAPVVGAFASVMEACSFQDLTCQRLEKIERLLHGGGASSDAEGLLNGPAARGQGLDQAAADALFADPVKG